jgi:hypothetical protein
MPQGKDRLHKQAKRALENDGWIVTHDPFAFRFSLPSKLRIDLGAEIPKSALEAERAGRQIAVEIKSFALPAVSTDLYVAVGQYYCYHAWLRRAVPNRLLYLAVPDFALRIVFQQPIGQSVQQDHGYIRLIGFDPDTERITRWIEID